MLTRFSESEWTRNLETTKNRLEKFVSEFNEKNSFELGKEFIMPSKTKNKSVSRTEVCKSFKLSIKRPVLLKDLV